MTARAIAPTTTTIINTARARQHDHTEKVTGASRVTLVNASAPNPTAIRNSSRPPCLFFFSFFFSTTIGDSASTVRFALNFLAVFHYS